MDPIYSQLTDGTAIAPHAIAERLWAILSRADRQLTAISAEKAGSVLTLWLTQNQHFAHVVEHADETSFMHVWPLEGRRLTLGSF